jgi:hypothetical protein
MSAELVSPVVFDWFLSTITGGVAGIWLVYDAIKLLRLRTADSADPVVRDKRFGYAMGMIIGFVGVSGVAYHHLG